MALFANFIKREPFPNKFFLKQNEPNPFSARATIKFCLSNHTKVTVLITNSYGKVVDKLISSVLEEGTYELEFFADGLSRGTYFCHVVADNFSESREIELIK